MSTIDVLHRTREDLASILDAKLKDMPEWRAMRAIDQAIAALQERPATPAQPKVPPRRQSTTIWPDANRQSPPTAAEWSLANPTRAYPTYTNLATEIIGDKGSPVTTAELIDYVGKHRPLGPDQEKAKVNITSSLSKDERFVSVPWGNGRAWWLANRELPKRINLGEVSP